MGCHNIACSFRVFAHAQNEINISASSRDLSFRAGVTIQMSSATREIYKDKKSVLASRGRVFWFSGQTCWSSAFRLFQAENMLKHELQPLAFAEEKTMPGVAVSLFEDVVRRITAGNPPLPLPAAVAPKRRFGAPRRRRGELPGGVTCLFGSRRKRNETAQSLELIFLHADRLMRG